MKYRRAFIPGGSFFFTLVTENRRAFFTDKNNVDTLRCAFKAIRARRPFHVDAIVVMPDHLHCIWTLPPGDQDFATRWRLIKTWFTKHCDASLRVRPNQARQNKREQAIWQHRYWEHALRDEADFERHVDYIHYNPIKHRYSSTPGEWPYSSFHRYVAAGIYPSDWGGGIMDIEGIGHE